MTKLLDLDLKFSSPDSRDERGSNIMTVGVICLGTYTCPPSPPKTSYEDYCTRGRDYCPINPNVFPPNK